MSIRKKQSQFVKFNYKTNISGVGTIPRQIHGFYDYSEVKKTEKD